mgnify:CR=1 FL=1
MLLLESPNGVNAQEKSSGGNTTVTTLLPADAVAGDTVTTLVTKPDGSTLVLVTVLTDADILLGSIAQPIATNELSIDGLWTTRTTITDSSGNSSPARAGEFILDTTPPAAGTGALASVSDTGTVGDNKTNDNTPALSGTAEANATVSIVVNGQTYTVTANAQGTWSLPATAVLPDGTYTPVITVTPTGGSATTSKTAICASTTSRKPPVSPASTIAV